MPTERPNRAKLRWAQRGPLLLLALTSPAGARLGETVPQLTARFGAASAQSKEITMAQGKTIEFGTRLTFRQDDWTIVCTIIEGRSARESYHKPGDWTEAQFTTILTSNAQGARWTDVSKPPIRQLQRDWRREDAATALWQMGVGLTVTHPVYGRAKKRAEAKAKDEASRLPKV